jgi:hypothetical protein
VFTLNPVSAASSLKLRPSSSCAMNWNLDEQRFQQGKFQAEVCLEGATEHVHAGTKWLLAFSSPRNYTAS